MVLWVVVILLLLRWTNAQFIQRYNNAPDANGSTLPAPENLSRVEKY